MESAAREDGDSNSLCEEKKVEKRKWMKTEFDSAERKEKPCRNGGGGSKERRVYRLDCPHEVG